MSVSVVRGTNQKPVASESLAVSMADCSNATGQLFIGYPIVSTLDGPHRIDALLVSPDHGLVVFDLIEGTKLDGYQERQDDSATKLEARLKTHRTLVQRRDLRIPIHALSFAPSVPAIANAGNDKYPLADPATLSDVLSKLLWKDPDKSTYSAALSAIENVSSIRKSSRKRATTRIGSRGEKLKKLEDSIATLDAMQGRAVIETVDGVQRIRGLAGSGKTIVLALKAAYLHAQHPDWRIAVTFHTRSLKGHFRRLINLFSIGQTGDEIDRRSLRIVNAWGAPGGESRDGLYCEFCRAHDIEYLDFRTARQRYHGREFAGVCQRALDQMRQSSTTKPIYDAILVDEAQDLPGAFLQICYELLDDRRRLVYAYDELQNLSGEAVSPPEVIFGNRKDGLPRVQFEGSRTNSRDLILQKCYRNSRPVLTTAHALGFGVYRGLPSHDHGTRLVQMFDSPHLWSDIGYQVHEGELKEGSKVTLRRTNDTSPRFLEEHSEIDDLVKFIVLGSKEQQSEWVAKAIKKNLEKDELRHDDVVVINPDPLTTRKEAGLIRGRLLDFGIKSHVAGVDTNPDVFFLEQMDSITFTGIHRAKGNEAAMVYVINAQDCHGAGVNLASIRNRLFVAITRSKAWVRVLGVGGRMQALKAEYEQLVRNDFRLQFTYPTKSQREQLRIVHRDMSQAGRKHIHQRENELRSVVNSLESGDLRVEDLGEDLLARLKPYIDR